MSATPSDATPIAPAPQPRTFFTRYRSINLAALLILLGGFGLAFFQVRQYEQGVTRQNFVIHGALPVPVTHLTPAHRQGDAIVIIVHGFTASKEIMIGFGLELARMGVPSYLLDLPGHAESATPMKGDLDDDTFAQFQDDLDTVVQYARAHSDVPNPKIMLLGHSIGTIIVSDYTYNHDATEIAATMLISPGTNLEPSPDFPANLLLVVEQQDYFGGLIQRSRALISAGCGAAVPASATSYACGDPAQGTGRSMLVAPGVNHITILTDARVMQAVDDWVAASDTIPSSQVQADTRLRWAEIGALLAFLALFPFLALLASFLPQRSAAATPEAAPERPLKLALWARILIFAPLPALAALLLRGWSAGADAHDLTLLRTPLAWTHLLLGDYAIAFLLVTALLGAALYGLLARRLPWQFDRAAGWQILVGIAGFAFLYLTVGTLATFTWQRFLLTWQRAGIGVILALCALPFFALVETVFADAADWRLLVGRISVFLLVCLGVLGGILLDPYGLGFLGLLLPVQVLLLLLLSLAMVWLRRQNRATGLAAAVLATLVFTWAVAAVFPIVA